MRRTSTSSSLLRLLLLLVLVLPVVHDLRDRRVRLRRNLDEVEVLRIGVLAGLVGRLDPELSSVVVDQTDTGDPDAVVDPRRVPVDGADGLDRPAPRPQRLITKWGLLLLESISCRGPILVAFDSVEPHGALLRPGR